MHESDQIASEFDGAVPRLECKCGRPHEPEVRANERRIEVIADAAIAECALWREDEPLDHQDLSLRLQNPAQPGVVQRESVVPSIRS